MKPYRLSIVLTAIFSLGILAGCNTQNENADKPGLNTVDHSRNENEQQGTMNNNNQHARIWDDYQYQQDKPIAKKRQPNQQRNSQPNSQSVPNAQQNTLNTENGQVLSEIEQEVIRLTNKERKKNGLPELKSDAKLSKVAQEKSNDMMENGYFSHTSPNYGSPFQMMQEFGVSYQSAGENIAAGQKTAEQVVQDWMNSPGHRRNILKQDLTHIGVGYGTGGSQGNYWTQMFIRK